MSELSYARDRMQRCPNCGSQLKEDAKITTEIAHGCRNALQDLHADLSALKKYRIPPQFFGPAAATAYKQYQDDRFQQFDSECINYIVKQDTKPGLDPKQYPPDLSIFKREAKFTDDDPVELLNSLPEDIAKFYKDKNKRCYNAYKN